MDLTNNRRQHLILHILSRMNFGDGVHGVEYVSGVEDVSRRSAGLMRLGTQITDKAHGLHRGFCEVCGSSGK